MKAVKLGVIVSEIKEALSGLLSHNKQINDL